MTKQHLIHQWLSRMMFSSITRYSVLSAAIVAVIAGISVLSMLVFHFSVLHTLAASLQMFNKVPFGEPWP